MTLDPIVMTFKPAFELWAAAQFGEGKVDLSFSEELGFTDDYVSAMFLGFCAGAMTGEVV